MNESIKQEISNFFLEEKKEGERISTLNNMGGMVRRFDEINKKFMDFTIEHKHDPSFKILEIGAAYGDVALECLKKGVTNYLINDLDERHIEIVKARAKLENIDEKLIKVAVGDFPDAIQLVPFYDAILVSRVLHFFEPAKWLRALDKLFYLLKPGGKIFVVVISSHVKPFIPFMETYHQRRKNGNLFPGYIKNIFKELNIPRTSELSRDPNCHFPQLNIMCKEILAYHFKNIGFEVLEIIEYAFTYTSLIWKFDGREVLGLIATKK